MFAKVLNVAIKAHSAAHRTPTCAAAFRRLVPLMIRLVVLIVAALSALIRRVVTVKHRILAAVEAWGRGACRTRLCAQAWGSGKKRRA